jgi:hypothetical protein
VRGQASSYTNNYFDTNEPQSMDLRKGRISV